MYITVLFLKRCENCKHRYMIGKESGDMYYDGLTEFELPEGTTSVALKDADVNKTVKTLNKHVCYEDSETEEAETEEDIYEK